MFKLALTKEGSPVTTYLKRKRFGKTLVCVKDRL